MDEVERLQQCIQQLEQELEAVRRNVSLAAYELRVPLTPMKGFIRKQIFVEIDSDHLHTILHHLVHEAITYSPDGGEVAILARIERPTEEFPTGALLMGVTYQGEDISKELFKQIVRVPYKKHRNTRGESGLGLYLSNMLIDRYGGYMWAESDGLCTRSALWFRIPLKQKVAET